MVTAIGLELLLGGAGLVRAAQPNGLPPARPSAHALAPYDLTGYWVSVVTEDWRYRMLVPGKGEYGGIPLNLAAKNFADAWSPEADEAAKQECKAYGVGALMRIPERLHITWQDDNTLKVETDAGQQTRRLRFESLAADSSDVPSLQGVSVASWILAKPPDPFNTGDPAERGPGVDPPSPPGSKLPPSRSGTLKVLSRHMLPGYLRKNGVPYSTEMSMTEYWDLRQTPTGDQWLAITTELDDPHYLQSSYVFSVNFKKEANGSKWDPTPCSLRW